MTWGDTTGGGHAAPRRSMFRRPGITPQPITAPGLAVVALDVRPVLQAVLISSRAELIGLPKTALLEFPAAAAGTWVVPADIAKRVVSTTGQRLLPRARSRRLLACQRCLAFGTCLLAFPTTRLLAFHTRLLIQNPLFGEGIPPAQFVDGAGERFKAMLFQSGHAGRIVERQLQIRFEMAILHEHIVDEFAFEQPLYVRGRSTKPSPATQNTQPTQMWH